MADLQPASIVRSSDISLTPVLCQRGWQPDDLLEKLFDDVVPFFLFHRIFLTILGHNDLEPRFLPVDNKRGKEETCFFSVAFFRPRGIGSFHFIVNLEGNSVCSVFF